MGDVISSIGIGTTAVDSIGYWVPDGIGLTVVTTEIAACKSLYATKVINRKPILKYDT